jgi:bleomycin hydrolase
MKKTILEAKTYNSMKRICFALLVSFAVFTANHAQIKISDVTVVDCTPVISQDRTGTCWSYATTSFLESELIRMGKDEIDLSEMYNVRKVYEDKALNYVLRQGKANFSQGSLSHDVTRTLNKFGVIPASNYSGLTMSDTIHNHDELSITLKQFLDGVIKTGSPSEKWPVALNALLDVYLGEVPDSFLVDGVSYSPNSYAQHLGLDATNYASITSFTHHPFHSMFILEIPDNYSNQSYANVPIEELVEIIDFALENGYSIAWDGDVSEKSFSQEDGYALLPIDMNDKDLFKKIIPEQEVTQENRQENFMNYTTTDDHLMHLVGIAKDKAGNTYYKIKNSWGEEGLYKGYLYMSEAYLKMKTIAITLHLNAIPTETQSKLVSTYF